MPRGGKRVGKPGVVHGNRTDLNQPAKTPPGQQYGAAKQSLDAQKVIPLPNAQAQQAQMQAAPMVMPGEIPFDAPTERPDEPITAGLPTGPGPGPEALNLPSDAENTALALRTIYSNVPEAQNNDFLRLVELAEQQGWT